MLSHSARAASPTGTATINADIVNTTSVTADTDGDILITAGSDLNSTGAVDIDAGNLLDVDGQINGTDIVLNADGDALIATALIADGRVGITADNDVLTEGAITATTGTTSSSPLATTCATPPRLVAVLAMSS